MDAANPSLDSIFDAAQALSVVLGDKKYALVGGAACILLGSQRTTADVDFVVPKGKTRETRNLLRSSNAFIVEAKTAHTRYESSTSESVDIEILTPPSLFQGEFDENTPTIDANGVQVLKPALILDAKCRSILGRSTTMKRQTDAIDIIFLLGCITKNGVKTTAVETPNVTKDFVDWFCNIYEGREIWDEAGFDLDKGTF